MLLKQDASDRTFDQLPASAVPAADQPLSDKVVRPEVRADIAACHVPAVSEVAHHRLRLSDPKDRFYAVINGPVVCLIVGIVRGLDLLVSTSCHGVHEGLLPRRFFCQTSS